MLKYRMLVQREAGLLQIHRPYFAQAMDDTLIPSADGSKRDLLHTRFAPSVLAVYRSSCLLIAGIRDLATAHPEPIRRWWFFWTTNYAAGIVLASLIIRCTSCHLASAALPVLDGVVKLFEDVKPMFAPANMMDILKRLQLAAHDTLQSVKGQQSPHWTHDDLELELPLLDGRTCLISRGSKTPSSSNAPSACQSPHSVPIRPDSRAAFGDVHPSVLEYFTALDEASPPSLSMYSEGEMRYVPQTQAQLQHQTAASSSTTSVPLQQQPFADGSEYWAPQWGQQYCSNGRVPQRPTPTSGPVDPVTMPQAAYHPREHYQDVAPFAEKGTNGAGEAVPMDLSSFPGDSTWTGLLDQLMPQSNRATNWGPPPGSGWGQGLVFPM